MMLWCAGVRHSSWAIQRNSFSASTRREHRRDILYWQRGSLWHLFPYTQTDDTNIRWSQPPRLSHNVRHYDMSQVPRTGLSTLCHSFSLLFVWEVRLSLVSCYQ